MTSYIVVSTDKKKRASYAKQFQAEQKIDEFDCVIMSAESSKNQQSIGIEDIKDLRLKSFLKPVNSLYKLVIIEDSHMLTTEAQNALLKILEEPPANTFILLGTDSIDTLLPTVISRCQTVSLKSDSFEITQAEREDLEKFLDTMSNSGIGERLKKAEELAKDKNEAINWISKLILALREKMLNEDLDTLDTIKKTQQLHILLKTTNVNPRFAIENTLLDIGS